MLASLATEQAAAQEAQKAGISLPTPPQAQLPEDVAWDMIYAEGGAMAVLLAIAVATMWKLFKGILNETRAQNQVLVREQADSIRTLASALTKVEVAIQISDTNNQMALKHLGDVVQASITRLDRAEKQLGSHHEQLIHAEHRLAYLERGASSGPGSGSSGSSATPPRQGG